MGARASDPPGLEGPDPLPARLRSVEGVSPASAPLMSTGGPEGWSEGTIDRSAAPSASPEASWLFFLLVFVTLGALPNQSLYWDDIGFLQLAGAGNRGDLAHLAYPPLIRLSAWLVSPFGLGLEAGARILSALGGGLVAHFAARRARGLGLSSAKATTAALLLVASHLVWRQGSVIEPSTLALAALLFTGERAESYARSRSTASLVALLASAAFACALHMVTALALGWWIARAWGTRVPKSHRSGIAFAALLGAGAFFAFGPGPLEFVRRALSYVPMGNNGRAIGSPEAWVANLTHLLGILREGAPCLSLAALLGLVVAALKRVGVSVELCALLVPHAILFALFGKPVVALTLPVFAALFELTVRGVARVESTGAGRFFSVTLPVLAVIGLGHSLRHAFHSAAAPDPRRQAAEAVADLAPPDSVILAGPLARHLQWWTDLEVIELPELMHTATAEGSLPTDRRGVRELLPPSAAEQGRTVWVTVEAIDYLAEEWQLDARAWAQGQGDEAAFLYPLEGPLGDPE